MMTIFDDLDDEVGGGEYIASDGDMHVRLEIQT